MMVSHEEALNMTTNPAAFRRFPRMLLVCLCEGENCIMVVLWVIFPGKIVVG